MSVNYPYCITFEGKVRTSQIIRLLYEADPEDEDKGHYHVCTSYMGFLERVFFCDSCNRGFNTDDFRHHPCDGARCKACKTIECGTKSHLPSILCQECHRHFYDQRCLQLHRDKGLCQSFIRCGRCSKEFTPNSQHPHRCCWEICKNYKEEVNLRNHTCFIQPVSVEEDIPRKKSKTKIKRQRKTNPHVSADEEPPVKVWADFEAMLDDYGTHIPILVMAETSLDDGVFKFYGKECTRDFLKFMDKLAYGPEEENRNWDDFREVIGIFHNLKEYDAVFL